MVKLKESDLLKSEFTSMIEGDNYVRFLDEGNESVSQMYPGKKQIVFVIDHQVGEDTFKAKKWTVSNATILKELCKFQDDNGNGLAGKMFRITRVGKDLKTKYTILPYKEGKQDVLI